MSKEESTKGLGEEIYSGAASFGVLYSFIGAIIGTIIGVAMIAFGIYLLTKKIEYDTVEGTIINLSCRPLDNKNQICSINISYKYNNKEENKFIIYTGFNTYMISQKIPIYIGKENPNNISLTQPLPKSAGLILSLVGLFIMLGGWFWYWASKKYKFVGAAAGVGGFLNLVNPHY